MVENTLEQKFLTSNQHENLLSYYILQGFSTLSKLSFFHRCADWQFYKWKEERADVEVCQRIHVHRKIHTKEQFLAYHGITFHLSSKLRTTVGRNLKRINGQIYKFFTENKKSPITVIMFHANGEMGNHNHMCLTQITLKTKHT